MRKITLFFIFVGGIMFAQQPQSYLELSNQNQTNEYNSETATVINNSSQGIIATYVAKVLFDIGLEENCSEPTVTYEDFLGGPIEIFDCGLTMSNAGDGCYDPGELEIGFQISASNGSNTVSIPAGAIGNTDPLAGAITFAEYTVVEFTPSVYAIAMDLWENNFPLTDIRVYGETGDLIETIQWDVPTNLQVFFGMIADEPISKIEVQGEQDSGELVGNLYFGATCEALSVNDHILSQLSVYPNPTNDIVTIKMPPNVELVSIKLFDVLGNLVLKNANLTQIDVSNLSSGLYLLDIITTAGTVSKKIVRK
ncbi:MAG: T9SS type A sorting domain-containing protein [Flavobacteriales bacterium]|nr:MAG: T9SS type A sorting domain-containing protein [Flavobacteriales bacterium]